MKLPTRARFSTICIHAGQDPDPSTGAIITPIFQTSTYVQDELGKHKGFEYARTQNPTRATLEANLAAIEGGRGASVHRDCRPSARSPRASQGDRVTCRQHTAVRTRPTSADPLGSPATLTRRTWRPPKAINANTKLVFVDRRICAAAEVTSPPWRPAHRKGAILAVDNTFASPCLQRPLELGADPSCTARRATGATAIRGGVVVAHRPRI